MSVHNQEYRRLIKAAEKQEQYPEGYFAFLATQYQSRRWKISAIVLFLLVALPCNIWLLLAVVVYHQEFAVVAYSPDPKRLTRELTMLFLGLAAVHVLLSSRIVRDSNKRAGQVREDWMKKAAERSGLSERVIADFDKQFQTGECWRLILDKDAYEVYVLTDDYYMVGEGSDTLIMRYEDIEGACFCYWEYFVRVGKRTKKRKQEYYDWRFGQRDEATY